MKIEELKINKKVGNWRQRNTATDLHFFSTGTSAAKN
jgi:hypothetical protein